MADRFDPYLDWLDIPKEEQPPNFYRLLNLRLFEDMPGLIESAVAERTSLLRTYQLSKHMAECQNLLNEIAAASVCLLDPQKKAAYDTKLRIELGTPAGTAKRGKRPPPLVGAMAKGVQPGSLSNVAIKVGLVFMSLAITMLFVAFMLGWSMAPQEAVLAFDWPASERSEAMLLVNGESVVVPSRGPCEHRGAAGRYEIVATRPGHEPFEESVQVESGQTVKIRPVWRSDGAPTPDEATPESPAETPPPPETLADADQPPAEKTPEPTAKPEPTPPIDEPEHVAPRPPYADNRVPMQPTPPVNPLIAASRSVVSVFTVSGSAPGQPATGFVVDSRGVVATSFLGIAGATGGRVHFADRPSAEIAGYVAVDKGMDLALLKVDADGLPALALSQAAFRPGDQVVALEFGPSSPGLRGTAYAQQRGDQVRRLITSAPGADQEILANLSPQTLWLQTSLTTDRRQRGAPLLTLGGEVVGMCVWTGTGGVGSNFALHAQEIRKLLSSGGNACLPLASLGPTQPAAAGDAPEIRLSSGKVFRREDYRVDMASAVALVNAWADEDDSVVQVKHGSLFSTAYVRHGDGVMNGVAVLFYDEETPKQIVHYQDNQRDGLLKLWDKDGGDLYLSQWSDGKRDGVSCLFRDNEPWLVCESAEDDYTLIAMVTPESQVKRFQNEKAAEGDPSAAEALKMVTQVENEIKTVHISMARNVRQEADREMNERKRLAASRRSVMARNRATARINARGAQRDVALGALARRASNGGL